VKLQWLHRLVRLVSSVSLVQLVCLVSCSGIFLPTSYGAWNLYIIKISIMYPTVKISQYAAYNIMITSNILAFREMCDIRSLIQYRIWSYVRGVRFHPNPFINMARDGYQCSNSSAGRFTSSPCQESNSRTYCTTRNLVDVTTETPQIVSIF
jgi:hypothetical protein